MRFQSIISFPTILFLCLSSATTLVCAAEHGSRSTELLVARQNGCVTPGYVPCNAPGSYSAPSPPPDAFVGSGFWSSIDGAASDPIQRKRDLERETSLVAGQNNLCCKPGNQCLVVTDDNVPFCYNSTSTRYIFSDESYGYVSNGTYYGSDGAFVNYYTGQYTLSNGTKGTFAPLPSPGSTASSSASGGAQPTSTTTSNGQTSSNSQSAPSSTARSDGTRTSAVGSWWGLESLLDVALTGVAVAAGVL